MLRINTRVWLTREKGKAKVEIVKDVLAESVLKETIKNKVKRGALFTQAVSKARMVW